MLVGPLRLAVLASLAAFGATGGTLALWGAGLPFLLATVITSVLAGVVQFAAQRSARFLPVSNTDSAVEAALRAQLEEYRAHTAILRHDLRGVLSPALMMSDRLLNHADPAVQRAGNAVVRSIDRATALLANSRDLMQPAAAATPEADAPAAPAPRSQ